MNEKIIGKYINNMTIDDLINLSNNYFNYNIPKDDAIIIYKYGKKYWKLVYNGDPTNLFLEIKKFISKDTYNKIIEIYNKYKK